MNKYHMLKQIYILDQFDVNISVTFTTRSQSLCQCENYNECLGPFETIRMCLYWVILYINILDKFKVDLFELILFAQ